MRGGVPVQLNDGVERTLMLWCWSFAASTSPSGRPSRRPVVHGGCGESCGDQPPADNAPAIDAAEQPCQGAAARARDECGGRVGQQRVGKPRRVGAREGRRKGRGRAHSVSSDRSQTTWRGGGRHGAAHGQNPSFKNSNTLKLTAKALHCCSRCGSRRRHATQLLLSHERPLETQA